MNSGILAWVLIIRAGTGNYTYSPPVKNLEDCQKLQEFVNKNSFVQTRNECIQINVLKKAQGNV